MSFIAAAAVNPPSALGGVVCRVPPGLPHAVWDLWDPSLPTYKTGSEIYAEAAILKHVDLGTL